MLSKSHERIVSAKGIPEERMKILRKLEDKAVGEINELDCIISNLIDKANEVQHGNLPIVEQDKQRGNQHQIDGSFNEDEEDEYEMEGEFDLEGDDFSEGAFNNL
jgi:hypothetical protein